MSLALVAASHSPLMGKNDPAKEISESVDQEFAAARSFIKDYDPELVVLFGPDHYNGMFYDMMPPFCVGTAAEALGDYDTMAGEVSVDKESARHIVAEVLDAGIDVAMSERMKLDHGFSQPLELLFGSLDSVPTVPIFINCVASPLGPVQRARLLGEAVGRAALTLNKRVLVIGSGGLSHDPPVPQLETAPPPVAERLIAGRNPSEKEREAREAMIIQTGKDLAEGTASIQPLNPHWDQEFLDVLESNDLTQIDSWTNEWFTQNAGHSSHEVRTWVAAYAALSAAGSYQMTSSFYREIPEWIAGFSITTATTVSGR